MIKRPLWVVFLAMVISIILLGVVFKRDDVVNIPDWDGSQTDAMVTGKIYKITKGKNSNCLWLKDTSVVFSMTGMEYNDMGKIIVYTQNDIEELSPGNTVSIKGKISTLEKASNDGGFDAFSYYKYTHNVCYRTYADEIVVEDDSKNVLIDLLYHIKSKMTAVIEKVYNELDAGIIKAMIYGDKSSMDEDVKKLFQTNGISHILAISGLHISIIAGLIYGLLRRTPISIKLATIITIIFISLYGIMTDFGVSTNRAAVMMIIMMIGTAIGRTYDMMTAIGISGIIVLIQNPLLIYSSSFRLSFLAVIAIAVVFPVMCMITGFEIDDGENERILKKNGEWNPLHNIYTFREFLVRNIKKSFLISACITVVTFPIVLSGYYEMQVLSVLLNLIVIPLMSIVVGAALITGIVGLVNLNIASIIGGCVHYILQFYIKICELTQNIPLGKVVTGKPKDKKIIIYYLILIVIVIVGYFFKEKFRCIKYSPIIVLMAAIILFIPVNDKRLRIDMLDVGQGDGICITTMEGKVIFIDGGSTSQKDVGKNIIVPYLKYHAKERIDYAMISHPDNDHISGIKQIIEDGLCDIGTLVLPDVKVEDNSYMQIVSLAKDNGICVQYLSRGNSITTGNMKLNIMYPIKNFSCVDRNDYSQVMELSYGKFNMMFTGDIGPDGEKKIIDYMNNCSDYYDIDILKTAHHGSNYSSSKEFLDAVKPELALISVGKDNDYGHPGKETLDRMIQCGCKYLTTIECGQISVRTDGNSYEVSTVK